MLFLLGDASMSVLKTFIEDSKTFIGFDFKGNYTMPSEIFYRLFEHFERTGENYLDVYSELQYLLWELKEEYPGIHDFIECEKYDKFISIARRLKLFDIDSIEEIKKYVKKCWYSYRDYLDKKRNEPRRIACRFTAMREVKDYVYSKYGRKCLCCGSIEKLSLDHVIPIQKGGLDIVENLQPLCLSCNSKKGTQIIDYRYD